MAVLETTTHEIKDDVRSVKEDVRSVKNDVALARNYALTTLIGGMAFVLWQIIEHNVH